MALPNVVVHRIDEWSPLCAPPLWYDEKGRRHAWRGVAPPNVLHDDVVDDEDERDSDVDLAPQNPGQSVVAGFPELLQRACDKEADARVLLQTEYGLARREARLARNMGDSADLGRADSPRRMTRIKSDGDIILEEGKSAVGVEEPEETKPELRKDHSTVGFPPRKAGDSGKPAAQHSRDHPYSSQREEETPRERAKRKNVSPRKALNTRTFSASKRTRLLPVQRKPRASEASEKSVLGQSRESDERDKQRVKSRSFSATRGKTRSQMARSGAPPSRRPKRSGRR